MEWPVFNTLDEVPEAFRGFYEEKDGKFSVNLPDADGLAEKGRLAIQKERDAAAAAEVARKAAEKSLAEAKLALQQKKADLSDDELKKLRQMSDADSDARNADKISVLEARIAELEPNVTKVRELTLDAKVKRHMLDAGVLPDRVDELFSVLMLKQTFDLTSDGIPKLVNHPGMAIDQYVKGDLKKRYPYHFVGSRGAGGGTGGAYTPDGKAVGGTTAEDVQNNPVAAITAARQAQAGGTR